jgi:UDP-glucose 4-epimerase
MNSGKKPGSILVIGGAGYIGCHMVKTLLDAGQNVIILDNLSTGNAKLVLDCPFIKGDIADALLLNQVFTDFRLDAVMHFAAFSQVGESVVDPIKYYHNNVASTTVLIQAMIEHKVPNFIFSSTAAVYGEPRYSPIDEDHPCMPSNPYGRTKQAVEKILQDCSEAYDFRYVSLRYFNAAGADPSGSIGEMHDPESHLIPLLLKVASGDMDEIKIFGSDYDTPDGTCIRDYIHVNDLADAHLLALRKVMTDRQSATYNLGNNKGYSVLDVLETARRVTGNKIPARVEKRRTGDATILVADSRKIREELHWTPRFESLDAIVESAWHWHRRHRG